MQKVQLILKNYNYKDKKQKNILKYVVNLKNKTSRKKIH